MKRRNFIKRSSLATGSLMIPGFLKAFDGYSHILSQPQKKIVVIQLSGGCDGLSAVVPYRNDIYYSSRKRLAISKENTLRLNDEMGLNQAMKGMKSLYDDGYLSIVNNVGYPNANRSHFRSMDIWHTASDENQVWSSGWLGRYMDNVCQSNYKAHEILELDDSLSLAMKGESLNGLAVTNIKMLEHSIQTGRIKQLTDTRMVSNKSESLQYLYKTLAATTSSADYLREQSKIYKSSQNYPSGPFGKHLKSIAELIISGSDTSVYYASLSGFDTHANQKGKLDNLLKQVSDGCQTLVKDLKQNRCFDDCSILIFSEFGRRVEENSSGGTDHGAGNNVYVISNQLEHPGLFNGPTDLSQLDDGDVKHTIDFRQIYASFLKDWLAVDDTKILKDSYKALNLFV